MAIQTMSTKRQLGILADELAAANAKILQLEAVQKSAADDRELIKKLGRDLDSRNILIDQLNREVNGLRLASTGGETSDQRSGAIDKYSWTCRVQPLVERT